MGLHGRTAEALQLPNDQSLDRSIIDCAVTIFEVKYKEVTGFIVLNIIFNHIVCFS